MRAPSIAIPLALTVGLLAAAKVADAQTKPPKNVLHVGSGLRDAMTWATSKELDLPARRALGRKLERTISVDLGLQLWRHCVKPGPRWTCAAPPEKWSGLMAVVVTRQDTTDVERRAFVVAAEGVLTAPTSEAQSWTNLYWLGPVARMRSPEAERLLHRAVAERWVSEAGLESLRGTKP